VIAAWMVYTLGVTGVLLLGGAAAEYVARALRFPTRAVWFAAMMVAVVFSAGALVPRTHQRTSSNAVRSIVDGRSESPSPSPSPQRSRATSPAPNIVADPSARARSSDGRRAGANHEAFSHAMAVVQRWLTVGPKATDAALNRWLVAIWITLSALTLLYWVVAFLRLRHLVQSLVLSEIDQGIRVWVSDRVGPAVLGLRQPRIVMPTWAMTLPDHERRIILAHEREHVLARDPALMFVAALLTICQPWNIGLWLMRARLRLATEADCDGRVLRQADPHTYSTLLLAVYERSAPGLAPLVAFLEPTSQLEQRIRRMLARKPSLRSVSGITAIVLTASLTGMAFAAPRPARPTSNPDSTGVSTQPELAFTLGDSLLPNDIDFDPVTETFYITSVLKNEIIAVDKDGRHPRVFVKSQYGWPLMAVKVDTRHRVLRYTEVAIDSFATVSSSHWGEAHVHRTNLDDRERTGDDRMDGGAGHLQFGDLSLLPNGDIVAGNNSLGSVYHITEARAGLDTVPTSAFRSPRTGAALNSTEMLMPDYTRGIGLLNFGSGRVRWLSADKQYVLRGISGLYRKGRTLIATQPGMSPERVVMFTVDASFTHVVSQSVLDRSTPGEGDYTHGVIVGEYFYYIVNSGWNAIDKYGNPTAPLPDARVMRVRIPTL